MTRPLSILAALSVVLAACGADSSDDQSARSATAPTVPAHATAGVRLAKVGSFDQPLYVTAPPGDRRRVFVVEQTGRIRVIRDGRKLATPFLDLRNQVSCCDERGLLSMAFPPDYATSRRFYVDYTDRNGDTRVVEFRRSGSPDRGVKASARLVLFQRQPESNHNGGLVVFGPDNLMYVGLGDGGGGDDRHGSRGNGQNLGTLLGKILRIDPRASGGRAYTVPGDNPFVGQAGARGEIYSYGLRNPWRFSFDRANGDIAIGDVGQDQVEEVDFARRGRARGVNYGWRVFEGRRRNYPGEQAPGAVPPVLAYGHGGGGCSVTGGYIVRDPGLRALAGQYVYGDYCIGRLRAVRLSPGTARGDHSLGLRVSRLSSFGEDARGRVYATSLDGPVYRLAPR
jgi:glucose/arabinose dehydrogenase